MRTQGTGGFVEHLCRADHKRAELMRATDQIRAQLLNYENTGRYNRVKSPDAPVAPPAPTARVLVADDDCGFAKSLSDALRKGLPRITPVVATSVSGAIESLGEEPVMAALVDLDLGDGLGVELIEKLYNSDENIPIVLMTGYLQSDLEAVEARLRRDLGPLLNLTVFDKTDSMSVLVEIVRRLTAGDEALSV